MDLTRPLAMVSGGPDSVAMLRVLMELGAEPVVLHLDHGLRGEESREDAKFVEELCENLGVPYKARRIELSGTNLQEEAREERYRLAEEVAEERGLSTVATGHIADDVAETVLLNLARGAGLRGLSGIPPVRGPFVRPLIERRRAEVLAYLEDLEQPYRADPTNLTPKYSRNRVRLEVLPVLEKLYPGASGNISRAASLLREDLGTLEDLAAGSVRRRGGEIVVPLRALRMLPHALQRYAVRRAYRETLPAASPLGSSSSRRYWVWRKAARAQRRWTSRVAPWSPPDRASSRSTRGGSYSKARKKFARANSYTRAGSSRYERRTVSMLGTLLGPRWHISMPLSDLTGCGWRARGIVFARWAWGQEKGHAGDDGPQGAQGPQVADAGGGGRRREGCLDLLGRALRGPQGERGDEAGVEAGGARAA
jgi:tRNA(Ile)-lysidine synthetase-like protein